MHMPAVLILGCCLGFVSAAATASDPVDLRGKQGVIDPSDLKKHDPPERSLRITEPPSPVVERPSGDAPKNPPSDEGGRPGGAAGGVRPDSLPRVDRLPGRPVR